MKGKCFLFHVKSSFHCWDFPAEFLVMQVIKAIFIKAIVKFKICNVRDWTKNNYITHIAQYLRSKGSQAMKYDQLIEYGMTNIFLEKL